MNDNNLNDALSRNDFLNSKNSLNDPLSKTNKDLNIKKKPLSLEELKKPLTSKYL